MASARASVCAARRRGGYRDRSQIAWDPPAKAICDDRDTELSLRVGPRAGASESEVTERMRVWDPKVDTALAE
jgi:hypothetical protein